MVNKFRFLCDWNPQKHLEKLLFIYFVKSLSFSRKQCGNFAQRKKSLNLRLSFRRFSRFCNFQLWCFDYYIIYLNNIPDFGKAVMVEIWYICTEACLKVWKSGGAWSNGGTPPLPAAPSDLPKTGGAYAPPAPPFETCLMYIHWAIHSLITRHR